MKILTKEKLEEVASWAELSRSKNVTISAHVVGNIARRLLAAEAQLTAPLTPALPAMPEAVNFIAALQDCDERTENQFGALRECTSPIDTTDHGEQLQCRTEGIIFATNSMLAAWADGFIYCPATEILEIATIVLSAVYKLTNATDDDFKRDDKILGVLREEIKKQQATPTSGVTFHNPQELYEALSQVFGQRFVSTEIGLEIADADKVFEMLAAVSAHQPENTEKSPDSDEGVGDD